MNALDTQKPPPGEAGRAALLRPRVATSSSPSRVGIGANATSGPANVALAVVES